MPRSNIDVYTAYLLPNIRLLYAANHNEHLFIKSYSIVQSVIPDQMISLISVTALCLQCYCSISTDQVTSSDSSQTFLHSMIIDNHLWNKQFPWSQHTEDLLPLSIFQKNKILHGDSGIQNLYLLMVQQTLFLGKPKKNVQSLKEQAKSAASLKEQEQSAASLKEQEKNVESLKEQNQGAESLTRQGNEQQKSMISNGNQSEPIVPARRKVRIIRRTPPKLLPSRPIVLKEPENISSFLDHFLSEPTWVIPQNLFFLFSTDNGAYWQAHFPSVSDPRGVPMIRMFGIADTVSQESNEYTLLLQKEGLPSNFQQWIMTE